MKYILTFLIYIMFSSMVFADDAYDWNWYFIEFSSPIKGDQYLMREGSAHVNTVKNKFLISFKFKEADFNFSYVPPSFSGEIFDKKITGKLNNIYPDGDGILILNGEYRKEQIEKDCLLEEIIFMPDRPMGQLLILSRTVGSCNSVLIDESIKPHT